MKYQVIDSEYIKYLKEYNEFLHMKKLMYKGIKYGYFIFIFIIILSAFFSGNLVLAQTSDIEFEFENGYAYNGLLPNSTYSENLRNITELTSTGHFPATYSFENDTNGSNPLGWSIADNATVINNIENHNKVVNMIPSVQATHVYMKDTFDNIVVGTIELWWRTESLTEYSYIFISPVGVQIYKPEFPNDEFRYYNGTGWTAFWTGIVIDTWYHIRIDFDCNTDSFDFYADGILKGSDLPFANSQDYLNELALQAYSADAIFESCYWDAIGYSWDKRETEREPPSSYNLIKGSEWSGVLDNVSNDDGVNFTLEAEWDTGVNNEINVEFFFDFESSLISCEFSLNKSTDIFLYDEYNSQIAYSGTGIITLVNESVETNSLRIYSLSIDPFGDLYILDIDYLQAIEITSNYNIGDNLIAPFVETDGQEVDKFEFTYDISGNMNVNGNDNVSGFTDIENDYWSNDVVNVYDSIDDDIDKAIRITSAQLGVCGIERDFDTDYVNTSQIHWQFDLIEMGFPETEIHVKIYNNASQYIGWFKLNGSYFPYGIISELADLSYYDIITSDWVLLQSNIPTGNNYNMTFQLDWNNGSDYGILRFDDVNYWIPCTVPQDSIGIFQIYAIVDHNVVYNTLDFQIDWIRVIVNGSSLSDELMPDNLFVLSGNPFSLLYQSFIEITFDLTYENNISIYLNDDILLLDYTYNATAERIYFRNLYQDKSYSGLYLKIYNSTDYNFESIRIYGIQLVNQQDSNDNPFLEFDYSNVDPNVSYFYVSGNDLYYYLETDDNANLEYIQATFDISDFSCEGYAVAFTHKKETTSLQSECKVVFTTDTYLSFLSQNSSQAESVILPQEKIVNQIVYLITDDTNQIIDTSVGYFSDLTFLYYSDIGITITTLSLLDMIPIIVIVVIIPIALYVGFGKRKELLVPAIMGMSLFGTVIGIIPLWLEFVILFACISYYLIRSVGNR